MCSRNTNKRKCGLFRTRSEIEPAVVVREIDAENPDNPVDYVQVIPKRKKKKKYLPGERLLIRLNKLSLKETQNNPPIDKLTASISKIIKELT